MSETCEIGFCREPPTHRVRLKVQERPKQMPVEYLTCLEHVTWYLGKFAVYDVRRIS